MCPGVCARHCVYSCLCLLYVMEKSPYHDKPAYQGIRQRVENHVSRLRIGLGNSLSMQYLLPIILYYDMYCNTYSMSNSSVLFSHSLPPTLEAEGRLSDRMP